MRVVRLANFVAPRSGGLARRFANSAPDTWRPGTIRC
jgi:hypothetical protein